jgi:hypothetical protein
MSDDLPARGFRWQALLQRAAEAVFVLDRRRRLLFVNRAWERLTDMPADRARGLVCRRPRPAGPDDSPEEVLAHVLTPPPEAIQGRFCQVRRLFLARAARPSPPQWWDVEFFPLLQSGPRDGFLILGRLAPRPVELPAPPPVLPERLEGLRLKRAARFTFDLLTSPVPAMRRLAEQARLASQVSAPVVIRGERGSGKRTVARVIHYQGGRRDNPFVALDCRVLPPAILADTLNEQRRGAGTLYLAEPARLPRDQQERLAGWLASDPARGPRLIAGLSTLDGLHEELLWRLPTMLLDLPPLRERLDDLPALIDRLRPGTGLTPQGAEAFRAYGWPGNCAELRRVLTAAGQRAAERIDLADLPMAFREARLMEVEARPAGNTLDLEATLAKVEAKLIRLALRRARGNRSRAAEMLGVHRPRLLRRIEALGIDEPGEGD